MSPLASAFEQVGAPPGHRTAVVRNDAPRRVRTRDGRQNAPSWRSPRTCCGRCWRRTRREQQRDAVESVLDAFTTHWTRTTTCRTRCATCARQASGWSPSATAPTRVAECLLARAGLSDTSRRCSASRTLRRGSPTRVPTSMPSSGRVGRRPVDARRRAPVGRRRRRPRRGPHRVGQPDRHRLPVVLPARGRHRAVAGGPADGAHCRLTTVACRSGWSSRSGRKEFYFLPPPGLRRHVAGDGRVVGEPEAPGAVGGEAQTDAGSGADLRSSAAGTARRRCSCRSRPFCSRPIAIARPSVPGPRARSRSLLPGRRSRASRLRRPPRRPAAAPRCVAFGPRDDVAAPVHAVGEVRVQVPGRTEHHLVARRRPAVGVRARVTRPVVRLDLGDPDRDPGMRQGAPSSRGATSRTGPRRALSRRHPARSCHAPAGRSRTLACRRPSPRTSSRPDVRPVRATSLLPACRGAAGRAGRTPAGEHALDIGCGRGAAAFPLADAVGPTGASWRWTSRRRWSRPRGRGRARAAPGAGGGR